MQINQDALLTLEGYTKEMIKFFREGLAMGFTQFQIRKKIKNELSALDKFTNEWALEQINKEIRDCISPCEFIITSFLVINHSSDSYEAHRVDGLRIYKLIHELAPEFIGPHEITLFQPLQFQKNG